MGYDINLRIRVYPADQYEPIFDALNEEHGICLDNHYTMEDQSFAEGNEDDTRWSGMTEDLKDLSKKFPTATIQAYVEGEDGQQWVEWYRDGKHYEFSRPIWRGYEDPVDESKLSGTPAPTQEDAQPCYSILIQYPDTGTWYGTAHGDTVEEAIEDARRQINEDNGHSEEEDNMWTDDELEVLAVIAGEHQDLKP